MAEGPLHNHQLAGLPQISERHFIRKMKALTGLPPQQYIRRRRLQCARQYLKRGECRTVKDAARAVGYLSTSYFIRQFEREFGKRPLEVLREWGWRCPLGG